MSDGDFITPEEIAKMAEPVRPHIRRKKSSKGAQCYWGTTLSTPLL